MGRFSDALSHRIRARRGATAIRHPAGAGVVMWCSSCRAELLRAPKGKAPSMRAQQRAVDAHRRVCRLRHLDPTATREAIERGARRMARRQRARRWVRWAMWAVLAIAVALALWLLSKPATGARGW